MLARLAPGCHDPASGLEGPERGWRVELLILPVTSTSRTRNKKVRPLLVFVGGYAIKSPRPSGNLDRYASSGVGSCDSCWKRVGPLPKVQAQSTPQVFADGQRRANSGLPNETDSYARREIWPLHALVTVSLSLLGRERRSFGLRPVVVAHAGFWKRVKTEGWRSMVPHRSAVLSVRAFAKRAKG